MNKNNHTTESEETTPRRRPIEGKNSSPRRKYSKSLQRHISKGQQRSPAIIIPKNSNKTVSSARTCRITSPKGTSERYPNFDDISAQTPHAQIVAELTPMISRCSFFMDYPIITIKTGLSPHPPIPSVTKKKETLSSIQSIVADPVLRNALSSILCRELFNFVEGHIFRPIPLFQTPNEFSEVPQNFIVKNWDHIELVHDIFQNLLQSIDFCAPLLDREFTFKLVQQLDSPVIHEQINIEKELSYIMQNYVGYRSNILRYLLARVIGFLDGVSYHANSMTPVLRLFLDYFKSLPLPMKQSNFLLFRTVFYPLFSKDLSYLFEDALNDLAGYFQSLEPATALWCLHYLKRHWPRASTLKQILFIHQFMRLLPTQPATVMEKVGPLVLKTIAPCIFSQNFKVAIIATSFVSDPEFINVYKPLPDAISEFLIPAAKVACEHWNKDEREVAVRLMDSLSDFHFRSKPATRAVTATMKKRDEQKLSWFDVIYTANSNDASIKVQEEEVKLEELAKKINDNLNISS